jgi:hypothetical protein
MTDARKTAGWVGVGVAIGGLLAAYFLWRDSRYVGESPDTRMPFDRRLWMAGKPRHREAMAHELVARRTLEGMSRAAVVEMLGEPDVEKPGDEGVRWFLGYIPKFLFDETLWLELTITEEGVVRGPTFGVDWYDPHKW